MRIIHAVTVGETEHWYSKTLERLENRLDDKVKLKFLKQIWGNTEFAKYVRTINSSG